jgi:hypothetical protein
VALGGGSVLEAFVRGACGKGCLERLYLRWPWGIVGCMAEATKVAHVTADPHKVDV